MTHETSLFLPILYVVIKLSAAIIVLIYGLKIKVQSTSLAIMFFGTFIPGLDLIVLFMLATQKPSKFLF